MKGNRSQRFKMHLISAQIAAFSNCLLEGMHSSVMCLV